MEALSATALDPILADLAVEPLIVRLASAAPGQAGAVGSAADRPTLVLLPGSPSDEELAALRDAGRAVRLGPAMHIHAEALDAVRARVTALLEADGEVTLGRLRDELGTSRKYAQALLERFDAERLTLRRGDVRVLRRRGA